MHKTLLNGNTSELHFTINFKNEKEAVSKFESLKKSLDAECSEIACAEIFGPRWAQNALAISFPNAKFPVSAILPLDETSKPELAGARVCAVSGADVKFFESASGSRASTYSDGICDYCRSFGICVSPSIIDPETHTAANISEMKSLLLACGFKFTDIVRTWFYNDDILSWYDPFNRARTRIFKEEKIFENLLPASTGIGAPNPSGSLISSGFIAAKRKSEGSARDAFPLDSPLQCGATEYGSSFSRAVELDTERSRRIFVSGSASIEPGGKTAHVGNIEAQVELTMQVIENILASRGLGFENVSSAVSYCLRPEYYAAFEKWLKARGNIAHVPSYSIVCRHDLLFEVELEASKNQ